LPAPDAETFVNDVKLGSYFEQIAKKAKNPKMVANWVINNLRAKLAERNKFISDQIGRELRMDDDQHSTMFETLDHLKFKPEAILELIGLIDSKIISVSAAQQVFGEMFNSGKSPAVIVQEKGLAQVSDAGAIEKFCDEVIAANPKSAEDFRAGKIAALNFLKGQVMKLSRGKANPNLIGEILEKKLKP